MITVAQLKTRAWKCYREPMVLDLEPKAYAIFAQKDGDPEASNFGGKSSMCEAIDFALYGRLVPEFRARKKGWISKGEKSGEVELTLSDGSRIQRSQTLTGSERLWYYPPGDPTKGATQDAAQQAIDQLVGLSREDFAATRYFRQGEMARLITLDPGPRLDLVAGWLRLGPLQDCEDDAGGVLREVARRRDDASGKARAADDEIARLYERVGLTDACSGPQDLESAREAAEVALREADLEVSVAREGVRGDREREAARAAAEAYERVVEQGKALAEQLHAEMGLQEGERVAAAGLALRAQKLANDLAAADEALRVATERRGAADAEAGTRRRLLAGEFDGRCPLVGAPCPSRAFVDDEGRKGRAAFDRASAALQQAAAGHAAAAAAQREAARALQAFDQRVRRLGELRAEAARLKPAHERWEALSAASAGAEEARAALARAEADHTGARAQVAALQMVAQQIAEASRRRDEARGEAVRLEHAVATAAAARAVFNASQRRLAESVLAEIEERANDELGACAIPLSVQIRWSREGSGAATTCGACGEVFPRSVAVKTCGRCGAPRGQQIINALTIEPSASSGGARDLCGIFCQLSAAAWLVEDRGAQWGTALLDEPLSALDAYHRRAIAAHLPAVLARSNVEQSFVIGHDRAALDSLPGRIQVVSEGGWSRATVIA